MTLRIENLASERNDRILFSKLNLAAESGDLVRVKGPNGSGKTTLLRMICGLLPTDEGAVLWHDRPIHKHRMEYHSELTYIGHKNGIKGDLTAEENLDIDRALAGHRSDLNSEQALTRFSVSQCRHQLCRQLSAGQRQRVALCRLLIRRTKLWVLDEPLTALDSAAQDIARSVLHEHLAGGGIAVITSHHDIEGMESAQRTIVLGNEP